MSYQTTMDNVEREGLANSQAIADGSLTGLASLDMEDSLELRRKRGISKAGHAGTAEQGRAGRRGLRSREASPAVLV